jgi:hypothetical protein
MLGGMSENFSARLCVFPYPDVEGSVHSVRMAEDEAVTTKIRPCKLFAEGSCPHGAACAFSHDADPDGDVDVPAGGGSGQSAFRSRRRGYRLDNDELKELDEGHIGPGSGGLLYGAGNRDDVFTVPPDSCMVFRDGITVLHLRCHKSSQVITHFGPLVPSVNSLSPSPQGEWFDSLAFGWSREHVAELFKGTEFSEFVEREGIDGYALAEIVARKEAFERLHPDWTFGKLCRLYKVITELTRKCDNEAVVFLPLAVDVDGMHWFKARSSVFDCLTIAYRHRGSISTHVHELRGVKLVSVGWSREREICLTFRSRVLLTHFLPSRDIGIAKSEGEHVTSLPTVSRVFCETLTKSFHYDLLNFSFTHDMAVLLPRSLRLAYKELLCIRKFCKDHPLAHFDKNLLVHLFKFVCSSVEHLCPVPLTVQELKYLAKLRKTPKTGFTNAHNWMM